MQTLSIDRATSSTSIIDLSIGIIRIMSNLYLLSPVLSMISVHFSLSIDVLHLLKNIEDLDLSDLDSDYPDDSFDPNSRSNTLQQSMSHMDAPKLNHLASIEVRKQLSRSIHKMKSNKVGRNLQRLTLLDVMEQTVSTNDGDVDLEDSKCDQKEIQNENDQNPIDNIQPLDIKSIETDETNEITKIQSNTLSPDSQTDIDALSGVIRSRSPAQTPETASTLPKAYDLMNGLNAINGGTESGDLKSTEKTDEIDNAPTLHRQTLSGPSSTTSVSVSTSVSITATATALGSASVLTSNSSMEQPSDLFVQRSVRQTARLLYDLVECKVRRLKGHSFTDCFVAKEAVTAMMENNLCLHREHGVLLCLEMENEGIIEHVLYERGAQKFVDLKDALYHWTVDGDGHRGQRSDSALDVAFGLHQMPAELIENMDLSQFDTIRRSSTLTQFKQTANHLVDLPVLSGWMEKQSAKGLKPWQKRWVIVRRTHLLWSKQQIDTDNPLDPKERAKFANSITLLTVKKVRAVMTKRKRKFDIVTPAKVYHFKCSTKEQRQRWLIGLQQHLNVLTQSVQILSQGFLLK